MFCRVHKTDLFYFYQGTGIPVVMLHGFGPDHRLLSGCIEPLVPRIKPLQRIYFDLPGMGQSPAPDQLINAEELLEIILAFIQKILGNRQFILVGLSYGGYLARALISHFPHQIRAALFICPVVKASSEKRQLPDPEIIEEEMALIRRFRSSTDQMFREIAVMQTSPVWQRYQNEVVPGLKAANWAFLERFQKTGYSLPPEKLLVPQPFEKPVLIITGKQDHIVGYQDVLDWLPDFPRSTYMVLNRAGHLLQIEQTEVFDSLVLNWFKNLPGTA